MWVIGTTGDRIVNYQLGKRRTVNFPASVRGEITPAKVGGKATYEFMTLNGGTDVYLLGQTEVKQ